MINNGKQFEIDFKSSIPSYCFVHRLRDSAMSYNKSKVTSFTWENECDFFIFNSKNHLFHALECKSTHYKSMSVQLDKNDKNSKMIKYHQIESLTKISKYDGIICGLLLNFIDSKNNTQRTYFIEINKFNEMMKKINKSSFNELDLITDGKAIKINGEIKRVHYKWLIDEFLNKVNDNLN